MTNITYFSNVVLSRGESASSDLDDYEERSQDPHYEHDDDGDGDGSGDDLQELERKESLSWIFRKAPFACTRSTKQRGSNLDVRIETRKGTASSREGKGSNDLIAKSDCSDSGNLVRSQAFSKRSEAALVQDLEPRNSLSWIFGKAPFGGIRSYKQRRSNLDLMIEGDVDEETIKGSSTPWQGRCRRRRTVDHDSPDSHVLRHDQLICSDSENTERSNAPSKGSKKALERENLQELEPKNSLSWIFRKLPFASIRSTKQRRNNLDVNIIQSSNESISTQKAKDDEEIIDRSSPWQGRAFDNPDKVLGKRSGYKRGHGYDPKPRASCSTDKSAQIATSNQLYEHLRETERIIAAQQFEIENQWTIIQKLQTQHKKILACQIDLEEMLRCMMAQYVSSVPPFAPS